MSNLANRRTVKQHLIAVSAAVAFTALPAGVTFAVSSFVEKDTAKLESAVAATGDVGKNEKSIILAGSDQAKSGRSDGQIKTEANDEIEAIELVMTADIMQIAPDLEYGEYLAGDCTTCHKLSWEGDEVPSIVGMPKEYLVQAMVEYKMGIRVNNVMNLRAQNVSNEEIAHLAEYFSSIELE
ncbi:MAG: hypothetical protein AAFY99_08635 [Pseudomonadota bacterium]